MIRVALPAGVAAWAALVYFRYRRQVAKMRALAPTLNQITSPFGLLSGLQRYDRDIWKESPQIFDSLKSPLFFFVTASGCTAHVNDAALFHEVCKKKQAYFPKAVELYDVLRIFGENIVTTAGETWKRHRRCASAAFSELNNQLVFETTVATIKSMFESWDQMKDDNGQREVCVLADATQLTLAIISSAAFGMKIEAFGSSAEGSSPKKGTLTETLGSSSYKLSFTRCMELVSQNTLPRVLLPKWAFKIPIFNLPEIGLAFEEFDRYLLERLTAVMADLSSAKANSNGKEASASSSTLNRKKQNLLTLLAQAGMQMDAEQTEGYSLTTQEILGNAFIFMLAGHETSAHALSFALALLALHPKEQDALYADVKRVLSSASDPSTDMLPILYSDLEKLEYCHAVMNESLRLFPPVVLVPKITADDCEIESSDGNKFHIPRGTVMNLNVYSMHRNPKHYPDPDVFRPSRWLGPSLDKSGDSLASSIMAAFSLGSRSCIGKRFAQIELVVALAMISQRYVISVPPGVTQEQLLATKNLLTLYPANDTGLIFVER